MDFDLKDAVISAVIFAVVSAVVAALIEGTGLQKSLEDAFAGGSGAESETQVTVTQDDDLADAIEQGESSA